VSDPQPPDGGQPADTDPGPGDFLVFLAGRANGTVEELTTGLAEVISAVQATKKSGRLALVIEVQPAKQIDGMVLVRDTVTTKIPKTEREPIGMFYVHDGGILADYPPGQGSLFGTAAGGAR
jgi:hypothetical protein